MVVAVCGSSSSLQCKGGSIGGRDRTASSQRRASSGRSSLVQTTGSALPDGPGTMITSVSSSKSAKSLSSASSVEPNPSIRSTSRSSKYSAPRWSL
nr:hypothetical protein [Segniliparus rugosus]